LCNFNILIAYTRSHQIIDTAQNTKKKFSYSKECCRQKAKFPKNNNRIHWQVPKILGDGIVVFGTAETIENALKIIEKKHSEVGGLPR
jgi:hypothetical protein